MAVTEVSIANSALVKVGSSLISDLAEDSREAQLINAIFEQERDATLRDGSWNFATKRVTLAPTATAPTYGYDFAYDLPSDCLKVLPPDLQHLDYVIENSQILCDVDSLDIAYIYRNTNVTAWDASFAEAFAWRIARSISYALTQSTQVFATCDAGYTKALSQARFSDGSEGVPRRLTVDAWTSRRRRRG